MLSFLFRCAFAVKTKVKDKRKRKEKQMRPFTDWSLHCQRRSLIKKHA